MLVVTSWRAAVPTTAAALVVLVLVGGCGAVGVDTLDVRAASASAETACASTAAALCARTRECGPFVFDKTYASVATCTMAITARCVDRYVGEGAATEITDCSARVAASSCEGLIDLERPLDPTWPLVACPVTPGSYPAGERCLRDGDCTTGLCSGLGTSDKRPCGICVEPPTPSVRGEAGQACNSDSDCASLRCADGRCGDLAKLGETCGGKPCDVRFGLTCGEDAKCGPVEQVPPGGKCAFLSGVCATGSICTIDFSSSEGTCMPKGRAGVGEPCTNGCAYELSCVNDRCAAPSSTLPSSCVPGDSSR